MAIKGLADAMPIKGEVKHDEPAPGLLSAAQDMLAAIEAKDAHALSEAMAAYCDMHMGGVSGGGEEGADDYE